MEKIALTGFTVFGSHDENPTSIMAQKLGKEDWINAKVLPVSFSRAPQEALELEGKCLLMTGLAAGRKEITLERFAYNEKKASIPDNDGEKAAGEKLKEGGEDMLETRVDLDSLLSILRENEIPTSISTDPGRYVCNALYYSALSDNSRPSLFVHFPSLSDMSLEKEEKAVRLILDYLLST